MNHCIAKANLMRCYLCFAFPFLALAAYVYKIRLVGDDFQSYVTGVAAGGRPLVSALFFFGGCIAWVVVTWPKARMALRYRGCAIGLDEGMLNIYGDRVEQDDIASVSSVRRPFDLQLRIQRKDGSMVARSITLLNPTPDLIVQRLKEAGL